MPVSVRRGPARLLDRTSSGGAVMQDQDSPEDPVVVKTPQIDSEEKKTSAAQQRDKQELKPQKMPLSRRRRALRWLLGLLIIFFLGVLAAVYLFYIPLRSETADLRQQLEQQQADIENASQAAQNLESEVDRLSTLERELAQAELHITLLSIQKDVNAARLALALDNPEDVRMALSTTAESLQQIETQIDNANQLAIITSLQNRLELVLEEFEDNPFAAQSDLEVMATDLVRFENALFARP